MAYTTIKKSSDYFNTILYTGDGTGAQSQTGVGFEPDMVWVKSRNAANYHGIADQVRGVDKFIYPNDTLAEQTNATDYLNSFDSDGFTHGSNGTIGQNSVNYVAWNWLANGAGSANTDGSISSTVSANTTSGFSIVSYTGTGSTSDSVGHGLSKTPGMIFVKRRDSIGDWRVWHQNLSATTGKSLRLNTSDAEDSNISFFYSQPPNSTTFRPGSGGNTNASSGTYIAYCFAEKKGFSKFGSYTGNGSTDGTFVYTGFKPSFVMHKRTDTTNNWIMQDNKRVGYNADNRILKANLSDAEQGVHEMDFVSNGFKIRTTGAGSNASGGNYIYMAFAEAPLVGDNPCTAR